MKKIAILADSGCQLPIGILEDQGIYIVPLTITMNDKAYLDYEEISALDVFERMHETGEIIKTSQPSTGVIQAAVKRVINNGYDHILAISIATGLSSTLSGMKLACDMAGMPVTLIDTKGTANNHRYLIKVAKKLIDDGKDVTEIENILMSLIDQSATLIMTPNLTHLKKGGRITPAVAMLGNLLKIVPVMKLNYDLGGKIDSLDKVRTVKKANLRAIEHMVNECKVNNRDYIFAIEHVLAEELAQAMKQVLIDKIGECQIVVRELPSVVGAHMGIGGIGYQYIRKYEGVSWNE
ncbi:MAG: DegV family protein [[Clostridium] spiroforme]|uniref:DegV family protein n=1 Tax=Thomasclavelia spiroformis TaxID=29348 RepID=A0A943I7G8_9FIRM|nr:DegV family protein [Thomasclavelia spiroformis]MBS5588131.1 DegV family protein [Thomasclavelia spiroformis]